MKKLLGIVVLGLLLSSNAYAFEIHRYCDQISDYTINVDGNFDKNLVDNNNKRAVLWIKPDEDPHMHFKYYVSDFAQKTYFKIYFVDDKWIKGKDELSRGYYNVLIFNLDNKKLLKIYFDKYDKKNAYTEWQC